MESSVTSAVRIHSLKLAVSGCEIFSLLGSIKGVGQRINLFVDVVEFRFKPNEVLFTLGQTEFNKFHLMVLQGAKK